MKQEFTNRVKYDSWPPTEEERRESRRKFISKYPASLIDVPENRKLFSREELEFHLRRKLGLNRKGNFQRGMYLQ